MTLEKRKSWIAVFLDKAERTARRTETRCLVRELLSMFLRGKWCFPRLQLFSNIQSYILEIWPCDSGRFCQKHVPCPQEKWLGKTVSVWLFSESPIGSPYLKQDLMCWNSIASLDRPLTLLGPFGNVVEMFWLFRLFEIGLSVQQAKWKLVKSSDCLMSGEMQKWDHQGFSSFLPYYTCIYICLWLKINAAINLASYTCKLL